ncbi:MAG: hypothetical protein VKP62_15940 [Candidatus Sericytochromatia bacterium]|nr:hypothetical protein [Candidatus Sericytochromatia bacterium]
MALRLTLAAVLASWLMAPAPALANHDHLRSERHSAGASDHPHHWVAEPIMFDLIRNLGARGGEREVGAVAHWHNQELELGTEVEWVPVDGHALELEVANPHEPKRHLKGAYQGKLGSAFGQRVLYGFHLLGGFQPERGEAEAGLSWVTALRPHPDWTALLVAGGRGRREEAETRLAALANGSLFFHLSDAWIVGGEANWQQQPGGWGRLDLLPQLRWDHDESVHLQLGVGVRLEGAGLAPVSALRLNYGF